MKKLIAAVTVMVVSSATANTIHVDIANCPGPGEGSVGDPYCSIQTAIDNAVDTDEIVVAEGTYPEGINLLGKAITVRGSDPQDPVVVANTIIDGTGFFHVVQCTSGESPETVLAGFTLTGGHANGSSGDSLGAGMINIDSDPTVTNCVFSDNIAGNVGGGMYNNNSCPTVTGCTFSANVAPRGGGMYNQNSSPTLTDCTFVGNEAVSHNGGGLYSHGSAVTATGCTFASNVAADTGGGIYIEDFSTMTLTDCYFYANTASIGAGGRVDGGSELTVTACLFVSNTSAVGSGLNVQEFCTLNVTDTVFAGNGTGQGGASAILSFGAMTTYDRCVFSGNNGDTAIASSAGTLSLTNSIFTNNTGQGILGGGIVTDSPGLIANCLFAANTCTRGGGIYTGSNGDQLAIVNCTFVDNVPAGITADSTSTPMVFNCIFQDNSPHQLTGDPIGTPSGAVVVYSVVQGGYPGAGNLDVDAAFVDSQFGTWTDQAVFDPATGLSTYFDATASYVPGELAGRALASFVAAANLHAIADNTATTITVYGDFALFGFPGADYRIDDYRLTVASPCIDAGDNNTVPAGIDTDLDSNPRLLDVPEVPDTGLGDLPIVDMGSYESLGDGCLAVTSQEIVCHTNGTAFTVNVEGLNACTGGTTQVTLTGSGGAVGEQLCFTALVNDGGFCCSTEICITIPDCSPAALPSDLDGDGIVGMVDFLALLGAWGSCSDCGTCPADFDGDCSVGILDLLILLGNWG